MKFTALVASASALNLNAEIYPHPDYYADDYSNTWRYTLMDHIVNETAYVADIPTGDYSDPWIYDEATNFAGAPVQGNALADDQSLLYLMEQHKTAHNQQLLE